MIGYNSDGYVTFAEKSSTGSITAVIAEDTKFVKAMLWRKNMIPVTGGKIIKVNR